MDDAQARLADGEVPAGPGAGGGGGRVGKPLAAGMVLAALLSWTLMSVALSLPFLLGIFFFLLFGLVIGATMFRFGRPQRPIARWRLRLATAAVTLFCMMLSLVKEGRDFRRNFVNKAIEGRYVRFTDSSDYERVRVQLTGFVSDYLRAHYPPGGVVGYLRYAAGKERMTIDLPGQPRPVRVPMPAAAWLWWARIALGLTLGYAGVYSQVAALAKPERQAEPSPSPVSGTA